ncbi:maltose ABC transporter substrate-binding protein [Nesterenkonia massiliensis]|uniref:Maltose ABC transporter substrate-binding protein n=1 Tax=Nesterenkonia massiliensis TaxID=1232429 RepID=A0ABT2HRK2_9MICC|nr:maltose ABC transporter substrate-binding protein [Nesterenkonia massiliensis]MCT1607329.1 maltose ABC transporter substrate-binding protein [Nesterenkonia massiliensis]
MRATFSAPIRLGALLSAGAFALTACGASGSAEPSGSPAPEQNGESSSAAPEAAGELTVWVDADRADVLADAAEDFEADTGIAVNLVQQDFGEIRDQFVSQVPTGEGPDIAVGAHDWLGVLVTNGVVAPIELGDAANDFEQVTVDAWSYDGQTYGVPYSIENIALLRNTELAPEAPETFDEMIEMGEASGATYPFLVGLDPQAADPYHLYPFQMSFGAPVFGTNEDASYNPEDLQIGNEGGQEFAQWLAEQGEAGVLNTNIDGDLALENFNSGDSPFYLTGPWNVPAAQENGIDVAVDPIPAPGDSPAQPFVGVQGFFLSAQSENVVAATNFLINYIGSPEVQTALYEVGGRAPALTESFDAALAEDEIVAGFGAVGADAVPMPSIPEMGAVWDFWGATQTAIINGEGDPVELWDRMAEDIAGAVD